MLRLAIAALILSFSLGAASAQGIVEQADCVARPAGHSGALRLRDPAAGL